MIGIRRKKTPRGKACSRRSSRHSFPADADLTVGKRRPALVLVDLPGDDLVLCQITTPARSDNWSVALDNRDFERGQLSHPSFVRPQRLFTVEQRVIIYSIGKVRLTKWQEVLGKARELFR